MTVHNVFGFNLTKVGYLQVQSRLTVGKDFGLGNSILLKPRYFGLKIPKGLHPGKRPVGSKHKRPQKLSHTILEEILVHTFRLATSEIIKRLLEQWRESRGGVSVLTSNSTPSPTLRGSRKGGRGARGWSTKAGAPTETKAEGIVDTPALDCLRTRPVQVSSSSDSTAVLP